MKCFLAILLCLFPFVLIAQNSELIVQLEALKKQVGTVEDDKSTYSQKVSFDMERPYRLEVIIEEIDEKGNSEERRAVFNLGLLDKNLVNRDNSRDLMWVNAGSGGMSVIKMYKNGVLNNYTDELELYTKGIDNARAIEEILEKAIPMAEAAWEKSIALPDNLPGLRNWIAEHIVDVDAGDASFKQTLELDSQYPARAWLTLESYSEQGLEKSERFNWNFGDLNEPSLEIRIKGKAVMVEAGTRQKQEFIQVEENGESAGFSNILTFYVEDADQAYLLVQALHKMIPLARTASEKMLPQSASRQEGVQQLSQQVRSFSVNQEKYEQKLTESSAATYTRSVTDDKGATEQVFIFDFSDLNEQAIAIEADKQVLIVEVPVKEKKSLVEVWEDDEQQNYTDQVTFFVPDLPTAKRLQHLLHYVINASSGEIVPQDFAWLSTTLAGFDEQEMKISQKLEMREGEPCKVAFSTREESSKKVDEHLFEFNLYDIDPDGLSLEVRGKTVKIILPAHYGEEIIKDYENEDKINYIKQVAFVVPDIETGKKMVATLEKVVRNCVKE